MTYIEKLKNIFLDKKNLPDEQLTELWALLNHVSMDSRLITKVAFLSQFYGTLKPSQFYKLLCTALPRGKRFIKYIKPDKKEWLPDEVISRLGHIFKTNIRETQAIVSILELYGTTREEVYSFCGVPIGKEKKSGTKV